MSELNMLLPPDPDGQNDDRAKWADAAITAFRRETGSDDDTILSDLLADLMHWSDRITISSKRRCSVPAVITKPKRPGTWPRNRLSGKMYRTI